MTQNAGRTETADLPPVIAMCTQCRRGYISMNEKSSRPSCIACGGFVTSITPRPNAWPYVKGAFVTDATP